MASLLTIGKDARSVILGLVDEWDLYTLRFVCRWLKREVKRPCMVPMTWMWDLQAQGGVSRFGRLRQLVGRRPEWFSWFKTTTLDLHLRLAFAYKLCCFVTPNTRTLEAFLPDVVGESDVKRCLDWIVSNGIPQQDTLALLETFLLVKAPWHFRWLLRSAWVDRAIEMCHRYGLTHLRDTLATKYGAPNRLTAICNWSEYSCVWTESLDRHYALSTRRLVTATLVPLVAWVKVVLYGVSVPTATVSVFIVAAVSWFLAR